MVLGLVSPPDGVTSCDVPIPSYQSCFGQWSPEFLVWLPRLLNVHKFHVNGLCRCIVDLLLPWHWRAIVSVLAYWMIWEETLAVLSAIVLNNLVKLTTFLDEHLDFHEVFNYFISLLYWLHRFNQLGLAHEQHVVLDGPLVFEECCVFHSFPSWAVSSSHYDQIYTSLCTAPKGMTQWLLDKEHGKVLL